MAMEGFSWLMKWNRKSFRMSQDATFTSIFEFSFSFLGLGTKFARPLPVQMLKPCPAFDFKDVHHPTN
jgi:hypothetical protein